MLAFVRAKVTCCGALLLLLWSMQSQAQLPVRNHNPLMENVGVPVLMPARLLDDGERSFMLATTLNSHFVAEDKADDPLFFDGESLTTDLVWTGSDNGWQWQLLLPWISYRHGFMDDLIIDWHDAFGLPGADREKFPSDQLLFSYQQDGLDNEAIVLDHAVEGVGDMRLTLSHALAPKGNRERAWHLQLKLPTGDSDDWLGSGSVDVALFMSARRPWQRWQLDWQYGAAWLGKPDQLSAQRLDAAGFASMALSYQWSQRLTLAGQVDGHTQLYRHTDQRALDFGLLASAGLHWQGPQWRWHLALLEDLYVDSAPDVGFQFGVEKRWR